MAINVSVHKKLTYDPGQGLRAGRAVRGDAVRAGGERRRCRSTRWPSSPRYAKAKPGALSYALERAGRRGASVRRADEDHARYRDDARALQGQRAGTERCGGRSCVADVRRSVRRRCSSCARASCARSASPRRSACRARPSCRRSRRLACPDSTRRAGTCSSRPRRRRGRSCSGSTRTIDAIIKEPDVVGGDFETRLRAVGRRPAGAARGVRAERDRALGPGGATRPAPPASSRSARA